MDPEEKEGLNKLREIFLALLQKLQGKLVDVRQFREEYLKENEPIDYKKFHVHTFQQLLERFPDHIDLSFSCGKFFVSAISPKPKVRKDIFWQFYRGESDESEEEASAAKVNPQSQANDSWNDNDTWWANEFTEKKEVSGSKLTHRSNENANDTAEVGPEPLKMGETASAARDREPPKEELSIENEVKHETSFDSSFNFDFSDSSLVYDVLSSSDSDCEERVENVPLISTDDVAEAQSDDEGFKLLDEARSID